MISFYKKNKLLFILIILTVLIFLISFFATAFFDKKTNTAITNNIILFIHQIKNGKYNFIDSFNTELINTSLYILFIWLIGISIIGIPVIIFLYATKLFAIILEITFLVKNIKITGIFFPFLYIIPKLLSIVIYFFLLNHAIRFSIVLIKMLFFKKKYNLQLITKRYIIMLIIIELVSLIVIVIENLLIPKFFHFII